MARPTVSYAQRFEDLYLMRCFAAGSDGFYIDIGSGHPVYDNTSFAFYLKGWHGITVELRPEQVVEIALDGVQASTRYAGGVALRFARVVRYRHDKTAAEADTIDTVRSMLPR